MEINNETLNINQIRKNFSLSDTQRTIIDLDEKLKMNLALDLRSKRGDRKKSLTEISRDCPKLLLLNEKFKLFFVNLKFENNRVIKDGEIEPILESYVEKYPLIEEGYALSEKQLIKCTLTSGPAGELSPEILIRQNTHETSLSEMKENIGSIQKNMINLKSSGVNIDKILDNPRFYEDDKKDQEKKHLI